MMVVASRHEHALPALEKPRVISEIKKNKNNLKKLQANINSVLENKPRIAGDLEWGVDGSWELRHVEVRDGSLLVFNTATAPELRLPLRHLSLQPASSPRTFCLVREHQSLATLQAPTDEQYERWVKTLAVELMRQTPLEAIRFLDILGITATIARASRDDTSGLKQDITDDVLMREEYERGRPKQRLNAMVTETELVCENRGRAKERYQRVRVNNDVCRPLRAQSSDPVRKMSDSDSDLDDASEQEVAALLLRCQQVDNYVPVREKRRLFESLCRRGRRLAQSSDNLCSAVVAEGKLRRKKRARSLHDLSRGSKSTVAVREICRYFEQCGQAQPVVEEESSRHKPVHIERSVGGCNAYLSRRRVQRAEKRLTKLKQQSADCEETIWRLQEEMAALDCHRKANTRSQELRLYAALEMRLGEEEARLTRLHEDAARTLREVEVAADKFETALVYSSEELTLKNSGRQ